MGTSGKLLFCLKRDIDNGEPPSVPLNAICMWLLEKWQLPQKALGPSPSERGEGVLNLAVRRDLEDSSPSQAFCLTNSWTEGVHMLTFD